MSLNFALSTQVKIGQSGHSAGVVPDLFLYGCPSQKKGRLSLFFVSYGSATIITPQFSRYLPRDFLSKQTITISQITWRCSELSLVTSSIAIEIGQLLKRALQIAVVKRLLLQQYATIYIYAYKAKGS